MEQDLHDPSVGSSILALATGGGKTYVAGEFSRAKVLEPGGRILWIAHRIELLRQAWHTFNRIRKDNGMNTRITRWIAGSGDNKDASGDVVLAMVLSAQHLKEKFDVIVTDEAHHAAATSYANIYDNCRFDYHLGLTATPVRLDKVRLPYDKISFQISLLELARDGWLAMPQYFQFQTDLEYGDLKRRSTVHGESDYTTTSLRVLDNPDRNKKIAEHYNENRGEYGKTIAFTIDVGHAHNLSLAFQDVNPDIRTAVLSGETKEDDRKEMVAAYERGDIDVLFNCMVLTEGFDAPTTKSVMLCRPTASKVIYLQQVGRGSRLSEGKTTFNVIAIVDGIPSWVEMAAKWSIEELGAEDEEAKAAMEEHEQEVDAMMGAMGLDAEDERRLGRRQKVEIYGFGSYWDRFKNQRRIVPLTARGGQVIEILRDRVVPRLPKDRTYAWKGKFEQEWSVLSQHLDADDPLNMTAFKGIGYGLGQDRVIEECGFKQDRFDVPADEKPRAEVVSMCRVQDKDVRQIRKKARESLKDIEKQQEKIIGLITEAKESWPSEDIAQAEIRRIDQEGTVVDIFFGDAPPQNERPWWVFRNHCMDLIYNEVGGTVTVRMKWSKRGS